MVGVEEARWPVDDAGFARELGRDHPEGLSGVGQALGHCGDVGRLTSVGQAQRQHVNFLGQTLQPGDDRVVLGQVRHLGGQQAQIGAQQRHVRLGQGTAARRGVQVFAVLRPGTRLLPADFHQNCDECGQPEHDNHGQRNKHDCQCLY